MMKIAESFSKFAELQKQGLGPVRKISGVAVDAFEKAARQNFALYGDVLDFSVLQMKLPVEVGDPQELLQRQIESAKAFTSKIGARVTQYVELGKEFQQTASKIIDDDIVTPGT